MWTNHVVKIRVKVCACYEEIKFSLEWGLDLFEGEGNNHRNNIKKMKCGLEVLGEFGDDYGIQGRRWAGNV